MTRYQQIYVTGGTPKEHSDPTNEVTMVNNYHGDTIGTLNFGEIYYENHGFKSILTKNNPETGKATDNMDTDEQRREKSDNVACSGIIRFIPILPKKHSLMMASVFDFSL